MGESDTSSPTRWPLLLPLAAVLCLSVSCSTTNSTSSSTSTSSTAASDDLVRDFLDDAARSPTVAATWQGERWMQVWLVNLGPEEESVGCLVTEQQGVSRGVKVKMNHRRRIVRSTPSAPRHGWPAFWRHLRESGAFAMRDESSLGHPPAVIHGMGVFFEFSVAGHVHHGSYNNPHLGKRPDQKRVARLVGYLAEELQSTKKPAVTTPREHPSP